MARLVVPYKPRLLPLPEPALGSLALAMLGDVLAACVAVGDTILVTRDEEARSVARELDARTVGDPGGGEGAAVGAALASIAAGPVVVVAADLPCATPRDLLALLGAMPPLGLALVRADDGTVNAVALATPNLHVPLYGPGSAERFFRRALAIGIEATLADIPNLADDVDAVEDLERLRGRLGLRMHALLDAARAEAV